MISFDYILKELGSHLQIPLTADENNACRINFDDQIAIQVEMDQESRMILMACELEEIPPGRFREEVFRSSLIENGKPIPRYGDLAFSTKNNTLVLFQFIVPEAIHFDDFLEFFTLFGEKAHLWKDGINRGQLPTEAEPSGDSSSEMLGLIR